MNNVISPIYSKAFVYNDMGTDNSTVVVVTSVGKHENRTHCDVEGIQVHVTTPKHKDNHMAYICLGAFEKSAHKWKKFTYSYVWYL